MRQDERFGENIITSDKAWCFAYDPATKRQSAEWVGQNSPKPKKLRFQKSRVKTMLIVFFNAEGVIHREFVLEGQKVNAEFHELERPNSNPVSGSFFTIIRHLITLQLFQKLLSWRA